MTTSMENNPRYARLMVRCFEARTDMKNLSSFIDIGEDNGWMHAVNATNAAGTLYDVVSEWCRTASDDDYYGIYLPGVGRADKAFYTDIVCVMTGREWRMEKHRA